jgi:hypothetical protein
MLFASPRRNSSLYDFGSPNKISSCLPAVVQLGSMNASSYSLHSKMLLLVSCVVVCLFDQLYSLTFLDLQLIII